MRSHFWQRFYIVSPIWTLPFIAQTILFDRLMKSISRCVSIFLSPDSSRKYFFQFQSLGLLGSIPAAALIMSLFCLLLYLMSRCCDRKPRPAHSITSLKVTLSIVTVLCCAAIGLGEFKNSIKRFSLFLLLSLTHIKFFFSLTHSLLLTSFASHPHHTCMSIFFIFHCRSF